MSKKPIPRDQALYEKTKEEVWKIYDRPSAYRSGLLVKRYKQSFIDKYGERASPYRDGSDTPKNLREGLSRWFAEQWKDVNPEGTETSYPVYRPTVRVTEETPLTVSEIDPKNLLQQSRLKQRLRDKRNLPPFQSNRSSKSLPKRREE